jgi:hypothetical protein
MVVSSNPANGEVYSIQHYVIKFVSDFRQVGDFLRYSGYFHQKNWPPRYNWNIVESGVKQHNPYPYYHDVLNTTLVSINQSRSCVFRTATGYLYAT